jgi:hypothetical protein
MKWRESMAIAILDVESAKPAKPRPEADLDALLQVLHTDYKGLRSSPVGDEPNQRSNDTLSASDPAAYPEEPASPPSSGIKAGRDSDRDERGWAAIPRCR